jgi:hypothetical protein
MEREGNIGFWKVATRSRKNKNEDPLPFSRKPSSRFGSGIAIQLARRGQLQVVVQWTRYFNKRGEMMLILPLGFVDRLSNTGGQLHVP